MSGLAAAGLVEVAPGPLGFPCALLVVPLIFDERAQSARTFRAITGASFAALSAGWAWIAGIATGQL